MQTNGVNDQRLDIGGFREILNRRSSLLRRIEVSPATKDEIGRSVGLSRATVDRAIRELTEFGLIDGTNGEYRLTTVGAVAIDEFDRFERRLKGLRRATDAINQMPADYPIDGSIFESANIVVPGSNSPRPPVDEFSSLIDRGTRVRTFGSVILPQLVDVYRRRIIDDGIHARIVVTAPILQRLVSGYHDSLHTALKTGRMTIREASRLPPFALVVADTATGRELGMLLYGDPGIRGYIGNDSTEAVRWGERLFQRTWEDAEAVIPTDVRG